MINVDNYKAFHGVMRITPRSLIVPEFEIEADWLYKPEYKCWYGNGASYGEDICTVVRDDSEKHIPKKPEIIKTGIGKCECGSLIERPKYRKLRQFCKWCGQAVDWE